MKRTGHPSREAGYALLVVLLALSVLVIGLAAAVPAWNTQIQREREARSIDHAREYRTAIKRYFHKNGRYPASLDVLLQKDGNGIRYLRQQWPDPLNLKADGAWQVLHYGQAVSAEIVDQPPAAAQGTANPGISLPGLAGGSTAGATPGGSTAGVPPGGAGMV
ncbi:MAG: type II secretion system protein, partial [Terriglobales bacterium]